MGQLEAPDLPGDRPRVHHVLEGDDERGLGAGAEERLERGHRVLLDEEELDRVGLEQRSAVAHKRQKLLAHPPGRLHPPA